MLMHYTEMKRLIPSFFLLALSVHFIDVVWGHRSRMGGMKDKRCSDSWHEWVLRLTQMLYIHISWKTR